MKRFFSIGVSSVLLLGGLMFGLPLLAVLGGVGLLISVPALLARQAAERSGPHPAEIGPDGRRLIRPLKALRKEIARVVESGARPTVQAVASSTLAEADQIIEKSARLLVKRREIKNLIREHRTAQYDLQRLRDRIEESGSVEERNARERALKAREAEAGLQKDAEEAIQKIDSQIASAEAALAELKSMLVSGAVSLDTVQHQAEELAGLANRLNSLSRSYQEAEETFNQRT